jgi:uncharacterized protein (TIGR03437 family)
MAPGSLIRIISERQEGAELFGLSGRSVYFGEKPAALLSVSPEEALAQAPFGIEEGPIRIEFRASGGEGEPAAIRRLTATIQPAAPASSRLSTQTPCAMCPPVSLPGRARN